MPIYWGARIDGATYDNGATYQDAPFNGSTASWDLFEQHTGKRVTLVHWGGPGGALPSSFDTNANANAHARGAFSLYSMGSTANEIQDLAHNNNALGTGALTKLDTWATSVANQGYPLMLRWCWEMNGNFGYPQQTAQGTSQADYVNAWRTMYNRITAIAPNVSFFWCPNQIGGSSIDPTPWYPGDQYVDWLGFDAYSKPAPTQTPQTWSSAALATYNAVCALNTSKPLCVGEVACKETNVSTDKPNWITDFLNQLPTNFPRIQAFSWYNWNNGTNIATGADSFPLEATSPTTTGGLNATASSIAFRNGIANGYYLANVAGSFNLNERVPVPISYSAVSPVMPPGHHGHHGH